MNNIQPPNHIQDYREEQFHRVYCPIVNNTQKINNDITNKKMRGEDIEMTNNAITIQLCINVLSRVLTM